MNGDWSKAIDRVINRPFEGEVVFFPEKTAFWSKVDWRDWAYKFSIIFYGAVLVFAVILLKSKTTATFGLDPVFFSYAIFITTFELTRILSAMLYESSTKSLALEGENFQKNKGEYQPKVAFVIPCFNEEKEIADSIDNCFSIDYPEEKLEVIAIDDGSSDRTLSVLNDLQKKYPALKVINWPNQGKRWAMAAGFKSTDAEIVVQLDSDSHVDPNTFSELISPFQNPRVAAVCAHGVPKNADKNIITRMQTAYYFMSFRILKAAESTFNTVFCLSGCCSAYRRASVMPVLYDWLSESFLGKPVTWGDDRALTSWLLKRGETTVYAKDAIAYTVVPENWKQLMKQQLRWKKSWIINSLFTGSFIWRVQPFVAFFYYFPLVFISFLTPFVTFHALVYTSIVKGVFPLYHIFGVIMVTSVMVLYYRWVEKDNKYWFYLFPWSILNLFLFSFIIVWAGIKIQDRGWGTR